jgi:hypothetical protein
LEPQAALDWNAKAAESGARALWRKIGVMAAA